jgi:GDP/UDP-N,N'-diacetylbacillosamine 2-epimerase (hydrolysing)
MGAFAMKVGVLTSSRADFGIYLPLLNKLEADSNFDLTIIAFGTHCSPYHGETIQEIKEAGFSDIDTVRSLLLSDDEQSIATSYGLTTVKFADYWSNNRFNLVFCLGDRFEMSAAVQAGIPQGITFAHLHGGETTLGAIDNIYRHQITHASLLHFTSTEKYAERVKKLIHSNKNVHNVGALSLDGINSTKVLDEKELRENYGIPAGPFILATFHPETVANEENTAYADEMRIAIEELAKQYCTVITMPNADTRGSLYRKRIHTLAQALPGKIITVENFGRKNYFSAMKYASLLLGNTSSGIIEAASFGKYVVNVGDRQKGRAQSKNVINCPFEKERIVSSVKKGMELGNYEGANIYFKKGSAKKIIEVLKQYNETL